MLLVNLVTSVSDGLVNDKIITAKMNTGPKAGVSPLELLENNEIFAPSIISQWFNPVLGASIAFVCSVLANTATKRPYLSGSYSIFQLHNHIISVFLIYMFLLTKFKVSKGTSFFLLVLS